MREPTELIKKDSVAKLMEIPVVETHPAPRLSSNYGYGSGYNYNQDRDDRRHLRDYLRSIRKRWWLIVGFTLLVSMLVAVYMARKPDIYAARARVQVDLEDDSAYGTAPKSGSIFINRTNDPTYFSTQLQILNSPALLQRVIKTLDLEHNSEFTKPQAAQSGSIWPRLLAMIGLSSLSQNSVPGSSSTEVPLVNEIAPATSQSDLKETMRLQGYVGALINGMQVEPVKELRLPVRETRLIDIGFQHPNPQLAAKIANTIADVFVLSNLEKKTRKSVSAGDFLQKRIAELQSRIRSGEEQLLQYARNNQIISLDPNQNTVVERLTGLNRQLLEAENERKLAESAYAASLAPGAAEALAENNAPQVTGAETKLMELRQKRAQLLVETTEEWPEVKELDSQIATLEEQVKATRTRAQRIVTTNLETRYKQALDREQKLREAFDRQRGETLTQNQAAINYRILQQEIETNKNLLDGILQHAKENEVALSGIANNISVIDYATTPQIAIGPRRLQITGLSFILALLFSTGLAIFLDYMDDSIRSEEDIEKSLHLPALAVVPTIAGYKSSRNRLKTNLLQLRSDNRSSGEVAPGLLTGDDPSSGLGEVFRQLRTFLLLSTPGHAPKTILITSGGEKEGKTTTAINTAYTLSQLGSSVLIVDADMRRPRIHHIFELENETGLSTILSSDLFEEELALSVKRIDRGELYVLPAGPLSPNPAELLGSEQLTNLLNRLQTTYNYIVIDSPPAAHFTDAVLLSVAVDGVLLVVNSGKSSRQVVRRTRKMLQDVGARILGVVLNHAEAKKGNYYYYYEDD